MSRASIALWVIIPLAWTRSAEAGHVLKVGPGHPYATIQSAVNAASDGDAVLVSPGTYAGFTITGKAIAVVQDGATKPKINGQVIITGVPAGHRTVLDGLDVLRPAIETTVPALRTHHNSGSVCIYRCDLKGGHAPYNTSAGGAPGVSSDHDDDLVLIASTASGGRGADEDEQFSPGQGGAGLSASSSSFHAYGCSFSGGDGGDAYDDEGIGGGYGGHGLVATPLAAVLERCTFQGGMGGYGELDDGDTPGPGWGGDGGDGLYVGSATVYVRDSQSTGGAGGVGAGTGSVPGIPGAAGQPYRQVGGTITHLTGAARFLRGATLARENEAKTLTFEGEPGDLVYLTLTTTAPLAGVGNTPARRNLSLNPPMFIGVIPASGILIHRMPIGDAVHGADVRWLILQPWFVDTVGATHTANELVWLLVDTGF